MAVEKRTGGFSDQEREAMRTRARELAAEERASKKKGEGTKAVLAAIEAMDGLDRALAQRIHELVLQAAPGLEPKTWYGMPAYAKDGQVVCFFQAAKRFEGRYATLGFSDSAKLDEGNMWPTSFALVSMTTAEEERILRLVDEATR